MRIFFVLHLKKKRKWCCREGIVVVPSIYYWRRYKYADPSFRSNLVLIPIVINTKYRIKSVEQHAAAAKKKEEVRRTTTLHTLFFRYRTPVPVLTNISKIYLFGKFLDEVGIVTSTVNTRKQRNYSRKSL